MKIQRNILILLIGVFLIIGSTESFAGVTRSCKAHYEIVPEKISRDVYRSIYSSSEFLGKGYEPASAIPGARNNARRDAYRRLKLCMEQHWENRNSDSKPFACTEENIYGFIYEDRMGVHNYPYENLEKELGRLIRNRYCGEEDDVVVHIRGEIYGDTGCGGERRERATVFLASNYHVNCSEPGEQLVVNPLAVQLAKQSPIIASEEQPAVRPAEPPPPDQSTETLSANPLAVQLAREKPIIQTPTEPPPTTVTCGGRIATIVGTDGPDNLRGTSGDDVIHGLGGNDRIEGGRGADIICGGDGDDQIYGKKGADKIYGEGGNDTIRGGNGNDECDGGPGIDTAEGCERKSNIP
jgi:hypothetical protein